MRYALLLLLPLAVDAATLTISPPVIYDCTGAFGKASLQWSGATGPVQVVVGPSRAVMTGLEGTSGSAETGTWVGDGLEFRLMNQRGDVEALAVAKVRCNAGELPGNGLVGASYFPLEVGNTWTYRTDSRIFTSDYMTWKVIDLEAFGGRTYAALTLQRSSLPTISRPALFLREDANGVLWTLTGTGGSLREEIYFNPATSQSRSYSSSLGSFPDARSDTNRQPLSLETRVFVRGVGLVQSRSDVLAGSSGGFGSSMELVEFRLASGPRVLTSSPGIAVSAESALLDVTGRRVTNCAIPCYFTACGFGGADPPNTFKPCARTRIEASGERDFWAELSLLNSSGVAVYRSPRIESGTGDLVRYLQVPLYSAPNTPLPVGTYRLVGRVGSGDAETATSVMNIEIR